MITCTKKFGEYPFAHRQPLHDGMCKLVHGHNWTFEVEFGAAVRDVNGFVVDFGKLKFIRALLEDWFDHTLVLSKADPEALFFDEMERKGLAKITWVDDVSCEGLGKMLVEALNESLKEATDGRVQVIRVRVYEEEKDWSDAFISTEADFVE